MAQISQNKLNYKTWMKVWNRFIEVFKMAEQENQLDFLFSEILSKTEKVMISKRISLCLLISSGWHTQEIAQVLHVSTATVNKFATLLESNKQFNDFLAKLAKQASNNDGSTSDFSDFIDDLFAGYQDRSRLYRQLNNE